MTRMTWIECATFFPSVQYLQFDGVYFMWSWRRRFLLLPVGLVLAGCGSAPVDNTSSSSYNASALSADKVASSKPSSSPSTSAKSASPSFNQYAAKSHYSPYAPVKNKSSVAQSTAKVSSPKQDLPAQMRALPPVVKQALATGGLTERGMSVYVKRVNSPKPLLAYQENTPRNPASVMKLLTTYSALGVLGPNYRWPVEVYTMGNVSGGVLQGDLIFKGYGYPDFGEQDLKRILQAVRSRGIRHIKGSLVFDNSAFRLPYKHPGSFDGKPTAAYNAQPDALLFKERQGCFVVNGKTAKASISCPESSRIVKVNNNLRMTNGPCLGRPKMKAIPQGGGKIVVEFYGDYSVNCGQQRLFNVGLFATAWKLWTTQMGGTIGGGFLQGRTPPAAKLMYTYRSKPLSEILPTVNKKSNNVMARQLLLTMSVKETGVGTIAGGVKVMNKWLASRGLHFPELRIENGSGLSRHSRVSAKNIGKLLDDAFRSPYRHAFMRSLAVLGVDGTLKRRMHKTEVRGRGNFKTGTLRDVRGIAGYVRANNGQTYIVSVLHNDPKARSRARKAHDEMIRWTFNGGGSQHYAMR